MGGEVFTAPTDTGTILSGITRDSVIRILEDRGVVVRQERFTIEDVYKAADEGKLDEAFATGTAAVISPVGEMMWKENHIVINNGEIGSMSQMLFDTITGIQSGRLPDPYGWTVRL